MPLFAGTNFAYSTKKKKSSGRSRVFDWSISFCAKISKHKKKKEEEIEKIVIVLNEWKEKEE